jgi:hypothetical protein
LDINQEYQDMNSEYAELMQKAALSVFTQYDDSVRGFYQNAKANLEVLTKMMFEYGVEGDDLIQNLKLHVQRFANNYNPEIDW